MTNAESVLWERLRNRRLAEMKFCRQHPIAVEMDGRTLFVVVDFFCYARNLVIEVDGSVHHGQEQHDKTRTDSLERLGLRVIRITNTMVIHDLDNVLRGICDVGIEGRAHTTSGSEPHPPSLSREGGTRGMSPKRSMGN
jgi:very-short-patch-repair endonuclease